MNSRSWPITSRISCIAALSWSVAVVAALQVTTQAQLTPPSSGLTNPRAIVFNPGTGKVYAVDTDHGAVQIYSDATKQMHRVRVGSEPVSIAVNTANGRAYVANAGDGTLTILDGNSDAVVATVPIGSHPYSVAVNSATGKVYVTHTFGDQLTILDGTTNTPSDLKTGSSDLIAINSQTGTIYLLGYGGAVKVLDGASQQLSERPVGRHAWALTLSEVTGAVYVTRIENADLAVIQPGSTRPDSSKPGSSNLTTLPAGEIPCAIAMNSQANQLYVANYGDNSVSVIDTSTARKTATIPAGRHPKAIAFDAIRNLVYVANTGDGTVTVIDAANNGVVATLPAGKNPYALAVVPGSSRLYVANESDDGPSTVVDLAETHKLKP
jgi:YVTN family beta-propeller protein